VLLSGGLEADGVEEIIEGVDDSRVATINSRYLFLRNIVVRREGPENAGRQWSMDFFIQFQEDQALSTRVIAFLEKEASNPRICGTHQNHYRITALF
jgi:hypothetical protein